MTDESEPARDLLEVLLEALTPDQLRYMEALPSHNWKPWKCCYALGYNPATLHRWLQEPKFLDARRVLMARRLEAINASHERVMMELSRVAFSDPRDLFDENGNLKDVSEWDDDTAAMVQSIDVEARSEGHGEDREQYTVTKVRAHSKMDALKTLSAIHGKLIERHEHTGKDGAPLAAAADPEDIARRAAFLLAAGLKAQESQSAGHGDNPPQTKL